MKSHTQTNRSSKHHPFPSVPFLFSLYTYYLWFSISFQFQFQPIQSFSFPQNLNLSPLERIAFQSRLSKIQDQVISDFPNSISSQGDSSTTTNNHNNQKEKDISRDLVLLFPGAGGPDVLTTELRNVIQQCDLDQNIRSQMLNYHPNNDHSNVPPNDTMEENRRTVIVYDWSNVRGNLFTAAYDGQAVGDALSQCFHKYYRTSLKTEDHSTNFLFRSLHIIGISVGAFAANQFLESCYQTNLSSNYRITYLDPFTSRGVTGNNYGRIHFGRLMKHTNTNIEIHAEHYLNTDDPVPSTNDALPNCQPFVYDITNAPERQSFVLPPGETNMHCWPVAYFARYGYESSVRKDDDHRVVWCFDK